MKADTCYYLSPTTRILNNNGLYRDCYGLFESWKTYRRISNHDVPVWGLDNGCFTDVWDEDGWLEMLAYYTDKEKETCLFAAVPDVVYDMVGTLTRFKKYASWVKKAGYPVALCTQDGMTPEVVPWDEVDCLFIGGSDEHKRGREAGRLISAAKNRDKWIHIGRVNSGVLMESKFWMADSWDGQTLARSPGHQYERIGRAVRQIRDRRSGRQSALPMAFDWVE